MLPERYDPATVAQAECYVANPPPRRGGVAVAPPRSEQTTVYRFFDGAGALLYVGLTSDPTRRLDQHRDGKSWWTEVSVVRLQHFDNRPDAAKAELRAIAAESPKYNLLHLGSEVCSECGAMSGPEALDPDAVAVLRDYITEHGYVTWRDAKSKLRDAGLRVGSGRISPLIREASK